MRRLLFFAISILLALQSFAQQQERYHRVKINTGREGLVLLAKAGIAVDHGTHKKGVYFITDLSDSEIEKVKETGLSYTVLISDVSRYYEERNQKKSAGKPTTGADGCIECAEYATPAHFRLGNMGGFYTLEDLAAVLDSMKLLYPDLITAAQPLTAATTLQGRPVYYVKISDNAETAENEPQVLYTALHHAREPESLSQLVFYMWYLLENYNTDPGVKYLVDHTELYFVPCVNPDGYAYNRTTNPNGGGMWRKNRRNNGSSFGVDLNRNYGKFWGYDNTGSSPAGNDETYRGPSGFSEPETQMIRDFCNAHAFRIALNAHTFSNLLIYPYGYLPSLETADSLAFRKFAADMAACTGFLTGTGDQTVGYVSNGDSDDWMYDEQSSKPKILSLTPEAGDQNDGFWPQVSRIIPIARQTMDQNLTAARLAVASGEVRSSDGPLIGNMNGYVHLDFKRTGLENSTFTVTLIPLSANIASAGTALTFTNPAHLQAYSDSIALTLNSTVSTSPVIRYALRWENSDGYGFADTFTRHYGAANLVFYSNGNSIDSFVTQSWGVSTAQYVTADGSLTDSPNGNYPANTNSSITTKGDIDLTQASAAYLTYFARWAIEPGYDYADISASDNGTTWQPLCGIYTHNGTENQDGAAAVYDGTRADWVKEIIDLSSYTGKKIKLRFTMHSDPGLEMDGFYFDEFAVYAVPGTTVGMQELAPDSWGLQAVPNPASESVSVYYQLPAGRGYKLRITDVLGRVVAAQELEGGRDHTLLSTGSWQSGVYFCRILGEKGSSGVIRLAVRH